MLGLRLYDEGALLMHEDFSFRMDQESGRPSGYFQTIT